MADSRQRARKGSSNRNRGTAKSDQAGPKGAQEALEGRAAAAPPPRRRSEAPAQLADALGRHAALAGSYRQQALASASNLLRLKPTIASRRVSVPCQKQREAPACPTAAPPPANRPASVPEPAKAAAQESVGGMQAQPAAPLPAAAPVAGEQAAAAAHTCGSRQGDTPGSGALGSQQPASGAAEHDSPAAASCLAAAAADQCHKIALEQQQQQQQQQQEHGIRGEQQAPQEGVREQPKEPPAPTRRCFVDARVYLQALAAGGSSGGGGQVPAAAAPQLPHLEPESGGGKLQATLQQLRQQQPQPQQPQQQRGAGSPSRQKSALLVDAGGSTVAGWRVAELELSQSLSQGDLPQLPLRAAWTGVEVKAGQHSGGNRQSGGIPAKRPSSSLGLDLLQSHSGGSTQRGRGSREALPLQELPHRQPPADTGPRRGQPPAWDTASSGNGSDGELELAGGDAAPCGTSVGAGGSCAALRQICDVEDGLQQLLASRQQQGGQRLAREGNPNLQPWSPSLVGGSPSPNPLKHLFQGIKRRRQGSGSGGSRGGSPGRDSLALMLEQQDKDKEEEEVEEEEEDKEDNDALRGGLGRWVLDNAVTAQGHRGSGGGELSSPDSLLLQGAVAAAACGQHWDMQRQREGQQHWSLGSLGSPAALLDPMPATRLLCRLPGIAVHQLADDPLAFLAGLPQPESPPPPPLQQQHPEQLCGEQGGAAASSPATSENELLSFSL